jgi:hypothetical protein
MVVTKPETKTLEQYLTQSALRIEGAFIGQIGEKIVPSFWVVEAGRSAVEELAAYVDSRMLGGADRVKWVQTNIEWESDFSMYDFVPVGYGESEAETALVVPPEYILRLNGFWRHKPDGSFRRQSFYWLALDKQIAPVLAEVVKQKLLVIYSQKPDPQKDPAAYRNTPNIVLDVTEPAEKFTEEVGSSLFYLVQGTLSELVKRGNAEAKEANAVLANKIAQIEQCLALQEVQFAEVVKVRAELAKKTARLKQNLAFQEVQFADMVKLLIQTFHERTLRLMGRKG